MFFGMPVFPESNHSEDLRSTEQLFLSKWLWTLNSFLFQLWIIWGNEHLLSQAPGVFHSRETSMTAFGDQVWDSVPDCLLLKSLWLYLWEQILYIKESPNFCQITSGPALPLHSHEPSHQGEQASSCEWADRVSVGTGHWQGVGWGNKDQTKVGHDKLMRTELSHYVPDLQVSYIQSFVLW